MKTKQLKTESVSKHEVLYKNSNGEYKKTYNTKIYHTGNRKFVLWCGMVCWLRRAYKGHYVVWSMQAKGLILN